MNYKGSIDLLKLNGATLASIEVAPGVVKNCVVVPVEWNDIQVPANAEGKPTGAYMNIREWETGDAFRKACVERNADKPDYVAPSHQLEVSYSEDFRKAAIAAAVKRLKADASFMAANPSEEAIEKEAKYSVSNKARLGHITPMQPKPQQQYQGAAPAATAGAYTPPAEAAGPVDDLPF